MTTEASTTNEDTTPAPEATGDTAAPKKAAKKAVKKAAPAASKKATKKAAKKAAAAPRVKSELTKNEVIILDVLNRNTKPLTRKDLVEKTGIQKGWSKTLGSSTKEDGGMSGSDSLEGRKLVKVEKHEGERALQYTITAKGKEVLARVKASA